MFFVHVRSVDICRTDHESRSKKKHFIRVETSSGSSLVQGAYSLLVIVMNNLEQSVKVEIGVHENSIRLVAEVWFNHLQQP